MFLFALPLDAARGAALTATILDAWWSNQTDSDGNGCFEPTGSLGTARLNWDPNVAGGSGTLTVFEKIYYKKSGADTWLLYQTLPAHTITNTITADLRYADIPLDNGPCFGWDYKIEIYRTNQPALPDYSREPANDADLSNHHEEAPCVPKATIADAWWSNQTDSDGDGCFEGAARLNWDPNVTCGANPLTVYEKIYFKMTGSNAWIFYATNAAHVISGAGTNDRQSIELALDSGTCHRWDYKIEIYRLGSFSADYTRSPANDLDLSAHREEAIPCTPAAIIAALWWTNRVDTNGDGCFDDRARLCWHADETCGEGVNVFEQIYMKPTGSNDWILISTLPPHWIVGVDDADEQHLDIRFSNPVCRHWDFKLELYRLGETVPDDIRDPATEPALSAQPSHATRPVLQVTPSGNQIVISWETNWVGYLLEVTGSPMLPLTWTTNSHLPGIWGTRFAVTNPPSTQTQFYRLKKP